MGRITVWCTALIFLCWSIQMSDQMGVVSEGIDEALAARHRTL
jgi:hypothetical protein